MEDEETLSVGGDMAEVIVEKEIVDCDECESGIGSMADKKRRQCKVCGKL